MPTLIERPIPKPQKPDEFSDFTDFSLPVNHGIWDVSASLEEIDETLRLNQKFLDDINAAEISQKQTKSGYFLAGIAVESANVFRLDQLNGEEQTRQRYAEFLGGVALFQSVSKESGLSKPAHRSSLDLLREAAAGSKESREALLMDTRTHVYEIRGGLGDPMEVELEAKDGAIKWNGQTTEERQFHTLTTYTNQAKPIRDAVNAEGLAGFRLEDRRRDGHLNDDMTAFDLSAIPNASQEELAEWGYFLGTMACFIRANRFVGDKLIMTSVSVGGVDERKLSPRHTGESAEDEALRQKIALQNRFDLKVLRKIHTILCGEIADNLSPSQILEKTIAASGIDIVDMIMLYDSLAAEEVDDAKTFFGSVKMWQDLGSPQTLIREQYERHMSTSQDRQSQYETLCQQIVDEQIRRASQATTPKEAVELKKRVVLDHMVERAVQDRDLDASRFGRLAEEQVVLAREYIANGQYREAMGITKIAKQQAVDSSCPPGERKKRDTLDEFDDDLAKDDEKEESCKEVKNGDKVNCPYCKRKVVAIVPEKGGRIYCSNKSCEAVYSKQK